MGSFPHLLVMQSSGQLMCVKSRTSLIKVCGQGIEIHSNVFWHHSVQIATAFELHSYSST